MTTDISVPPELIQIETAEWYQELVSECRAIIVEAEFTSRWALVEGYHALGERIVTDKNLEWHAKGNYSYLQGLANNIGISERTVYYAIQFYNKYPTLDKVPEGKAISWNKIVTKYLPAPNGKERTDFSDAVLSASDDETQIVKWIMRLYNLNQPFDLDPTYSTGRLWEGLPKPKYRFDLDPQVTDCQQADARRLPFADASLSSIFFDPPFVAKDTEGREPNGIIESRFSGIKTIHELQTFYTECLHEFKRILEPRGLLAFKCQDGISGGIQYLQHVFIINVAEGMGLHVEDLFVLVRKNVMFSPNMTNQQHARKNHSYYLVILKEDD